MRFFFLKPIILSKFRDQNRWRECPLLNPEPTPRISIEKLLSTTLLFI